MPEGRLYIGNRRYSSWSMRGWLAVRLAGLDVEEVMIHFAPPRSDRGDHRGCRPTDWCRISSTAVCACGSRSPCASTVPRSRRRCGRRIRLPERTRVPSAPRCTRGSPGLRQSMWMNLGRDFSRTGPHAGGARRHRAHRGDVDGHATALRRRWAVPVRCRIHPGRCDVCAGGDAVLHLATGYRRGDASLLRSGACASAGELRGTMEPPRNRTEWLLPDYENAR